MKIQITQEDIDRGERHSPSRCPVALSIKRHTGATSVRVYGYDIFAGKENGGTVTLVIERRTPSEVLEFINRFDHGYPVEPCEFEL